MFSDDMNHSRAFASVIPWPGDDALSLKKKKTHIFLPFFSHFRGKKNIFFKKI